MDLNPQIKQVVITYYENDARKLQAMVDKIIRKLNFTDIEISDFYSLANEVFVKEVLPCYDGSRNFDGFLYSCLYNKFCSEMTWRHRSKRCVKVKVIEENEDGSKKVAIKPVPDFCIDAPLNGYENVTIGEAIADNFDIHKEAFEWEEEGFSGKMNQYLSKLSSLQKDVLRLMAIGYTVPEIKEELHITSRQYNDCLLAIRSYRNISVLF